VPETVDRLVKEGFEVIVETRAGRDYNLDENYEEAGATVAGNAGEVYGEADLIVKVARPTDEEVRQMREGQILLCFLNGPQHPRLVKKLADAGVTVFSNEAIPRTTSAPLSERTLWASTSPCSPPPPARPRRRRSLFSGWRLQACRPSQS
jgi:NAD(P) transhydrogenase subunit alpha